MQLLSTRIKRNILEKINTKLAGESPAFMITNLKIKLMNRNYPFGYGVLAGLHTVKINVNLLVTDASKLVDKNEHLAIYSTGRGDRIRVEGFITGINFSDFLKDLEIYKLDYKVNKLLERKVLILDTSISTAIADLNDLPF